MAKRKKYIEPIYGAGTKALIKGKKGKYIKVTIAGHRDSGIMSSRISYILEDARGNLYERSEYEVIIAE